MEDKWILQDWEKEAQKDEIYALERRMLEEEAFNTPETRITIIIEKSKTKDTCNQNSLNKLLNEDIV